MNIKDWQQFSDAVDKDNDKAQKRLDKLNKKRQQKFDEMFGKNEIVGGLILCRIEKTEVNFWEWKCGKLKL